jgi:predicted DCC family thiol-disulfide oxidoreductase YuxK
LTAVSRLVVLYDRDCSFCAWSARPIWDLDRRGRLEFLALQDAATSARPELVRAAAERPLMDAIHALDVEDGTILVGGRAMIAVFEELPGGALVRAWVRLPFIPPLIDLGYRAVARNRHRIGRWLGLGGAACTVPTGPRRSRSGSDAQSLVSAA